MDTAAAATRAEEPDSRNSLRHILAAEPPMEDARHSPSQADTPAPDDSEPADAPDGSKAGGDSDGARAYYTSTTTTTRRNANGSVSSVYSGNKIKHLKKDDGIPLWRKDIQYDFLKLVFEDDKPVFTKQSDPQAGPAHTFADIYLDAMAKSSKCSKILKDKLLTERPAAVNMAMVCLLVNVGRMNTTLNCECTHPRRVASS
jgi:Ino eighty subunit 1